MWRKRVEIIRVGRGRGEVSNSTSACLATILRFHGSPAALGDIDRAVGAYDAATLVKTADVFGLRGTGLKVNTLDLLHKLALPCIAHVIDDPGPYPRPISAEGRFEIVERVGRFRPSITTIEPELGVRTTETLASFGQRSTSVFLTFARFVVPPPPVARVVSR